MRTLDGDMVLARIFMGDSDKWHHQPLYRALVERLRKEGFAGATVFHATLGYGARSIVHTSSIVDLGSDLPIVVVGGAQEARKSDEERGSPPNLFTN
jgi:PII-like signaling protein